MDQKDDDASFPSSRRSCRIRKMMMLAFLPLEGVAGFFTNLLVVIREDVNIDYFVPYYKPFGYQVHNMSIR